MYSTGEGIIPHNYPTMPAKKRITRSFDATREGVHGEAHGRSVLTDDIVTKCREFVRRGAFIGDLAKSYGVSLPTMSKAVLGVTWQHLPDPVEIAKGRFRLPRRKF